MKFRGIILSFFLLAACSSENSLVRIIGAGDVGIVGNSVKGVWSIPVKDIYDSGAGKDGIPSIDAPRFFESNNTLIDSYLFDEDLVIGLFANGEARAYPHKILDYHEIVNDAMHGKSFSISYCPLTGSSFGWESKVGGQQTSFGVSGLLYNSNLILYDRYSDSYWSQMLQKSISGKSIHQIPKSFDVVESTWGMWKKMYPETKVLSNNQGFDRDYKVYPYGGYKKDDTFLLFPLSRKDNRLDLKERVLAVLHKDEPVVFRLINFYGARTKRISFKTDDLLIVGNANVLKAFSLSLQQRELSFSYSFKDTPHFFSDNEGNQWSIFGEAISGPRKGEKLQATNSLMTYWLAVPPFFSQIQVYE